MDKDIREMTLKDIKELKEYRPNKDFNAIVILPNKTIHDSGYECMDFVFLDGHEIVGKIETYSDVINIGEILSKYKTWWSIDCLPKSHLLRLFTHDKLVFPDFIGSTFTLMTQKEKEEWNNKYKRF